MENLVDEAGKSDEIAIKLRNEGNVFFRQGQFVPPFDAPFKALLKYNESLCFAKDQKQLAFAYANRSAVYFELGLYDHCLRSIKLALQNNYPLENMSKLKLREEKCRLLILRHGVGDNRDPFDDIKLSYSADPKIPFLVDGLEVKTTEKYGRGIYAKRSLKVGDIISIETPYLMCLDASEKNQFQYCGNCLEYKHFDLTPWEHCSSIMFCSEECKAQALEYHEEECTINNSCHSFDHRFWNKLLSVCDGSLDEIYKLMEALKKRGQCTIYDFDLSSPNNSEYSKNLALSALSTCEQNIQFGNPNLSINYVSRISVINLSWEIIGQGINLFSKLINESCIPNVHQIDIRGKVLTIVAQPIAEGEQLFKNHFYGGFEAHSIAQRKEQLNSLRLTCDCEACKNPERYTILDQLPVYNEKVHQEALKMEAKDYKSMKPEDVIMELKNIASKCQKYYAIDKYPCREYSLMYKSFMKAWCKYALLCMI